MSAQKKLNRDQGRRMLTHSKTIGRKKLAEYIGVGRNVLVLELLKIIKERGIEAPETSEALSDGGLHHQSRLERRTRPCIHNPRVRMLRIPDTGEEAMIVKEIIDHPELIEDFDWFNDYRDTKLWLKHNGPELLERFEEGHLEWLEEMTEKNRKSSPDEERRRLRQDVNDAIRRAQIDVEYMEEHKDDEFVCGTPLQLELDKWSTAGDRLYELSQEGYYKFLLSLIPDDSKPSPPPAGAVVTEIEQLKDKIEQSIDRAKEEQRCLDFNRQQNPNATLCETSLLSAIADWYHTQQRLRELGSQTFLPQNKATHKQEIV